jgi:hypothetical protein
MKTQRLVRNVSVVLLFALLAVGGNQKVLAQAPQPYNVEGGGGPGDMGPMFTYQGMLKNGSTPVNGNCDMQFGLYDQSNAGNQLGAVETQNSVAVTNGLFSVTLNYTRTFGNTAFQGGMRWLDIFVRCPAGSGNYTELLPRQMLTAAPYAAGLVPGSYVRGTPYQILKVVSDSTATGVPAAVTGEIMASLDGVGVYGSNAVNTSGSTGIGVWGRTYSLGGAGVKGTGYNGSVGVYAESNGNGIGSPALFANATSTHSPEPGGIAVYALNNGPDAALVVRNSGTGDVIRAMNAAGSTITFRVDNAGNVHAPNVASSGGDLAEEFTSSAEALEPGTLMVIDAEHPGQLIPSSSAYDPLVAGIVSGAGDLQPGVTLSEQGGVPVALAGRVYVKAEANSSPIRPGDLLTSSSLPGYAMRITDRALGQGAAIGKAMSGLDSGTGLVLVLVSLQ